MGFLISQQVPKSLLKTMAPQQKQTSSGPGLVKVTVLAAAGAGIYYYHKDMTKEELREAGERYAVKTKELACQAYELTKMLVQKAHAMYQASQSGEQDSVAPVEQQTYEEETMGSEL